MKTTKKTKIAQDQKVVFELDNEAVFETALATMQHSVCNV